MYPLEMTIQGDTSPSPFIPANQHNRSDETAPAAVKTSQDLLRQKRKKWAIYMTLFAVFQLALILFFALVVMKTRPPSFMVRSASFGTFDYNRSGINPSFNFEMTVDFGVKNANFGPYKYEEFNVYFYYEGDLVGTAVVSNSKAGFLSTSKFPVFVNLSSAELSGRSLSTLAIDLSTGVLPLTSNSTMNGKVEIMMLFSRKKSISMECNMGITYSSTRQLQDINCKG